MLKNGMLECSVCHSKLVSPSTKTISRAYDKHRSNVSSKNRALNVLLVFGDCFLVGLQARQQKVGEKPLLSVSTFVLAARNNILLAIPALLYAINNYLKFIMQENLLLQLYFNPATVKMLSNLKCAFWLVQELPLVFVSFFEIFPRMGRVMFYCVTMQHFFLLLCSTFHMLHD
ncbi:hypothetical protein IEQ34_008416 [Dendrobium chrysotoxum]|uniref:Uncharacterized protein n=1 Tax=Dendrobium chrysotoxum TaxID=161865 RepID=A0AAV7GVY4_DENCH|nr:hypothetical protein IEQ34_008416 [Dendrobium chrysotoxum]